MTIEKIETTGFEHIQALRIIIHQLWAKQCEHDGVNPEALVVAFSNENPYTIFYNNACRQYQEAMAAAQPGGGYVGLQMAEGRATFPARKKRKAKQ